MTILSEVEKRNLPKFGGSRDELKSLILEHEFGFLPPAPYELNYKELEKEENYFCGQAVYRKIRLYGSCSAGDFSFPIYFIQPKGMQQFPVIVNINFRPDIPDLYLPSEELCDSGFGVLSVYYNDVTTDDGDFTTGIGTLTDRTKEAAGGKISLWAWSLMRCMDFLETQQNVDLDNISVSGHSRLGKTAILTGALDKRFKYVFANNSGCSGGAIHRGKTGERIEDITRVFPHWFCPGFSKYANREFELPFDHHLLLGLIAPRYLYIACAADDDWADFISEFLCCVAATPIFEECKVKGLVAPDFIPSPGDVFHGGNIGYHLRDGVHFLGRRDWSLFTDFVKAKMLR